MRHPMPRHHGRGVARITDEARPTGPPAALRDGRSPAPERTARTHRAWLVSLVATALIGCFDETPTADDAASPDVMTGTFDAAFDAARAAAPPEGGPPPLDVTVDHGVAADATSPDATSPDAAAAPPTCVEVCGRYAECGTVDPSFGDAGCFAHCQRAQSIGDGGDWLACVQAADCDALPRCEVPPLRPLPCDDICALAEVCGVEPPLTDCVARCEAAGAPFQGCGEALYGHLCDNAPFAECVTRVELPVCVARCEPAHRCGIAEARHCLATCDADHRSADPLAALHGEWLDTCVAQADGDCERLERCHAPQIGDAIPADPRVFCDAYAACGAPGGWECAELLSWLRSYGLSCAIAAFDGVCLDEASFWSAIERCAALGQGGSACQRLCTAREACERLADDATVETCARACSGPSPLNDEVARAAAVIECGLADRCVDFDACIASHPPEADCAAHCASLDRCGLADEGCHEACLAQWPRDRHAAWRACVSAARRDCAEIAACAPTAPPCALYCERAVECRATGAVGCEERCDDEHFAQPLRFDDRIACTLTTPSCSSGAHRALGCGQPDGWGRECLMWCRATTTCAGDPADYGDCLVNCGRGYEGDTLLRFAGSQPCTRALPTEAPCAALRACVPISETDCDALCDRAAACGVHLTDCRARCAADPLSRLRAAYGEACITPDADCATIAACLVPPTVTELFPPDEPAVDQATFCAAFDACPDAARDRGDCDAEWQRATRNGDRAVGCMARTVRGCDAGWRVRYDGCIGWPHLGPAIDTACVTLCQARSLCEPESPTVADCVDACIQPLGAEHLARVRRAAPLVDCGRAWSCPELSACVARGTVADTCAALCAARVACQLTDDADACARICDAEFARDAEVERRACLDGVAPGDCAAIAACDRLPGR